MKKRNLLMSVVFVALCASLFAKADTYIYDYWGEIEKSPDVYRVSHVFYADDLKLGSPMRSPSSLFCYEDKVYVVDTGNNRIVEFTYGENKTLVFNRIIDRFNSNGQENVVETFNGPTDIFINKTDGSFFIADKNNSRVVKLDKDLNYVISFTEPDDPTYQKGKTFLPEKVVADESGRTYVLAQNVNRGFIKYEYDGSFTGFYGASEVTFNFTDYLWKRFSTRAQREQMEQFVPTEYSNAYMDSEGFIFAVTKTFDSWDLKSDQAKPIRRLNAIGQDILIKNGEYPPIGDLQWSTAGGMGEFNNSSRFTDITVLENEVYVAVDETRGRLFGYNSQGNLLFAFGGTGSIDGFFRKPSAIEHMGRDLFVLDSLNASLTVFTPTTYGDLIYDATELYAVGDYDGSADKWSEVLKLNGNYDLAYIGLGKAYMRQNKYKEAMEYFGLKRDKKDYSKAFQYYRKEVVEDNIGLVMAIIVAIILIPYAVKFIRKIRLELKSL